MRHRVTNPYSEEFKRSSAKLAAESAQPISQTAKDLGINATTLYGWVDKYHPKQPAAKADNDLIQEELKRLRKENARLKEERTILKKAAAYFAKDIS